VLFFGFGESGSCPVVFAGIAVEGPTVRLLDDQPAQDCTDDYNRRTLAVSVAKGVLPEGYLTVDILIRNDTADDRVATGQVVTIDRWTGHHFETLGQVTGSEGVVEVGPQATGELLQLDTGDPEFPTGEPGWLRLTAHLDVATGDFGRLDARGYLQLTEQTAEAP
jgi:hypothetical protein